jgi:hypothetical protein
MCDEIIEFQGAGHYDLTYMLSKELSWKVNHRSQNAGIEEFQRNIIADQRKVLKIWEDYITELYDRANRTKYLEIEPEEKVDAAEKCPRIFSQRSGKSQEEMNKKPSADVYAPGNGITLSEEYHMKYDNTTDQGHV